MKILVTGAKGQLGSEVCRLFEAEGHDVYGFGRENLDFTDQTACGRIIREIKPDVLIHCGAYTAVDKAESEPDEAYRVNASGTRNLAVEAEKHNAKFCYVSTDYVFDGSGNTPYNEYDNTNPRTVYGKSKRAGEILAQTLSSRYFIVRTSWVYGRTGQNFVKTMLKLGGEKASLNVVHDQTGSPTYAADLASFLMELVQTEKFGIYHASNSGTCTWYEFTKAIFEDSDMKVAVNPCTTDEFPRPAERPKYSVMDHMGIRSNGFQDLRSWRDGLRDFLKEYRNGE
ncbi:dTDP-4-dehydrorhamnose reductase [Paenibacillus sp. UNC499MF]|uniref:dTDP-4-dehydrorhamnose reductase n=1 Tax=Paenibacillus sp. UNC499MF TaxID=1502751 RepID=UPI0008A05783|nr:dTDP-4-dehydrorhamnose reductase [Paenibacillus sp. UNC499MF]SEG70600.1 dTDP-4-dehydrorhamnose reductase [Paenibacillus sp. UNC499MF]